MDTCGTIRLALGVVGLLLRKKPRLLSRAEPKDAPNGMLKSKC